jgi:predicted O-linked N-acetylglucosamine transferase (SPINDLY family)
MIQMRKDKKWDARSIIQRKRGLSSTEKEPNKKKAETETHTEFQVMMDKNGVQSQYKPNNNKSETLRLDIIEIEKKQKAFKELQQMEKEVEESALQYKDMKKRFDERQRKIRVNDELLKAKEQDQAYREAELVSSEKKLKQRLEDVTTGVGLTDRIGKCLKRLRKDDDRAGKKKKREEKGRQEKGR